MRFILLTVCFAGVFSLSFASTDSLIIQGKILNLNGRLYRQAPSITFSRNNVLQPQLELSKQAPLAADGSFRISLPLIYKQEEIYLDYSGKAFTTFLGSPGTVDLVFDGDSIQKAKKLFYFAGENAEANNRYPTYLAEEQRLMNANPEIGSKFYETFWDKTMVQAQDDASKRRDLKNSALTKTASAGVVDLHLSDWARSIAMDEMNQNLYEYALSNQYQLGKDLLQRLTTLSTTPLTSQKVSMANRFANYADQKVEEKKNSSPGRTSSLPVRLMAKLIRDNTPKLTEDETSKLNAISSKGIAEKIELDFLSNLFARNEMVLNLLFDYERESRIYGDLFDSTAREFLKARFLPKNFHKYTYRQQTVLSKHVQSRLSIPEFSESLDEIVKIEVKDSIAIKKMIDFTNIKAEPTEVLPGYFISASNERGVPLFTRTLEKYQGKTIYLVKWNLNDAKSREELEYIPALQSQLPADVVFVYYHLDDDVSVSKDLIKQFIVRHHLKGTHLFLSGIQTMDLQFKLNPIESATFVIIKPNGKFYAKNAPAPSLTDKAAQTILEAASR